MGYVMFLLLTGIVCFVAGWMLRAWGLDDSTRMSDGYERERRDDLVRELNGMRVERDDARTQVLTMRAASTEVPAAPLQHELTEQPERSPALAAPLLQSVLTTLAIEPADSSLAASSPDDLKLIKGIGPKLEQTLVAMGITRFAQISAWTQEEVEQVNARLRFSGRIERDRWIEQARAVLDERGS